MIPSHYFRQNKSSPHPGSLNLSAAPKPLTGLGAVMAMQILHQSPAIAAWDLPHAAAVEDLLKKYIKTLPGGATIAPPRLFIYKGKAFSRACPKSGIDAPAYCPGDHTVYLEMGLGDQVAESYGDFGALSIIAHEFGHAYMFKRNKHPVGKEGELAADAFAGGFARYAEKNGALEPGDLDEARATFASVGDYEVYHHDHHGTPMERRQAFENGYLQGFRLPGDRSSETSAPPARNRSEPASPKPRERDSTTTNQPTFPAPNNQAERPPGSSAPVLGLVLGAGLFIALLAGVVTMVARAREENW